MYSRYSSACSTKAPYIMGPDVIPMGYQQNPTLNPFSPLFGVGSEIENQCCSTEKKESEKREHKKERTQLQNNSKSFYSCPATRLTTIGKFLKLNSSTILHLHFNSFLTNFHQNSTIQASIFIIKQLVHYPTFKHNYQQLHLQEHLLIIIY